MNYFFKELNFFRLSDKKVKSKLIIMKSQKFMWNTRGVTSIKCNTCERLCDAIYFLLLIWLSNLDDVK
jgi:hypothetical protein